MTLQDKIKPLIKNIKSVIGKDHPATFQMEGYEFEINKKHMLIRFSGSTIMYKSKSGFSQEKLENRIDDAIKYFRKINRSKASRLKRKGIK